jgi:Uma2 family endonuclease
MANLPVEKTAITLDDLMAMEDAHVEIINGEMTFVTAAGIVHHLVAGNIYRRLDAYVGQHGTGAVFFDGLTYLMGSDVAGLKHSFVPDVSFIRAENIPAQPEINKPFPGVPDLAVEVVSPGDSADGIQIKLRAYLERGTSEVWIVYPATGEVHQYRRQHDPEIRIYRGSQQIDAEALFPGLELTTSEVFHLPDWATS